jgi:nucleoside-diphosphate-sugar epimerase
LTVLIIGGTRFVGYLLVWRLIAAGHRVTLFNRGWNADPFGDRVERLRGDRTTEDLARLLVGRDFDAAVDFAAYTGEDAAGAVRLFDGRVGHYVFISTGQVYLVREGCPRPSGEADYDGAVMPEPIDPDHRASWEYGVGKRAAEDTLVQAWEARRFPSTRLRIPMVNGERDHYRRVECYLRRILDGGPVLLPDGGTGVCRHVYGGEVARAIAGLLGKAATQGEAYNLCQGEEPTLAELVTLLAGLLGAPARLEPVSPERITAAGLDVREVSPFSGRWMSHLDPSRAKAELGFRHEPLEAYFGKMVASFLAHPPEEPPPGYERREVEVRLV